MCSLSERQFYVAMLASVILGTISIYSAWRSDLCFCSLYLPYSTILMAMTCSRAHGHLSHQKDTVPEIQPRGANANTDLAAARIGE